MMFTSIICSGLCRAIHTLHCSPKQTCDLPSTCSSSKTNTLFLFQTCKPGIWVFLKLRRGMDVIVNTRQELRGRIPACNTLTRKRSSRHESTAKLIRAAKFRRGLCAFNTAVVYSNTWGWKQCCRHEEVGAAECSKAQRCPHAPGSVNTKYV